jgi:hypothetical protein
MIIIYPQTQVLFDFRFALDKFYYSNSKEIVLTLDSHLNNVFVETFLILFLLVWLVRRLVKNITHEQLSNKINNCSGSLTYLMVKNTRKWWQRFRLRL